MKKRTIVVIGVIGTLVSLTACKSKPLLPANISAGRVAYISSNKAPSSDLYAGTRDLFVIDIDGNNRHLLAHLDGITDPAWSPDGTSIAFVVNLEKPRQGYLCTAKTDGTLLRELTSHLAVGAPSWSPDSKKIAYQGWDVGSKTWNLNIVNSDGKNDHKVGSDLHTQTYANWSPDGKQILFHTLEDDKSWHIAVVNADGSHLQKLTSGLEMDWLPSYSPDGTKIAFWSTRTGSWEIFVMNTDGSTVKQLTHENGRRSNMDNIVRPVWSPDGKCIVYVSKYIPGKDDLLVIDMEGRQARITDDSTNNVALDLVNWWKPSFSLPNHTFTIDSSILKVNKTKSH